jgi:hypothetical protein
MEETDTDDSNSFVTSVKAKAKRVLLKAKVIGFLSGSDSTIDLSQICLSPDLVCSLHAPCPLALGRTQ